MDILSPSKRRRLAGPSKRPHNDLGFASRTMSYARTDSGLGPDLPEPQKQQHQHVPLVPSTLRVATTAPSPPTREEDPRRITEALILSDRAAIREMQREIAKLESEQAARRETEKDDLIARLLSANDASLTVPTIPRYLPTADPDIPSALPLPVSDPLPQLRAFSSLTFTTTRVTTLPPGLRRSHEIRGFAGAYGVGALDFWIEMVADTGALMVEELQARVSHWARGELGGFVNECIENRDPQLLLYAINSYHPLCTMRAKVFASLCSKYPTLLPAFTKRRWAALMGVETLCFSRRRGSGGGGGGGTEFVLTWRINVDDVGEAESRVEGEVRVPIAYQEVDKENRLGQVGALFADLLEERGVKGAVGCMVELFFKGEEGVR
ncbi:hypothetical protein K440DRAFT_659175 [Wilcoxina mikolae CBS 423.85]|nr:hypothetical protein K440DRAFT_659175 [Wilcoxina mikolae CBS 423.85]